MRPVILTNAFRRPRATRLFSCIDICSATNVYACVEELVGIIHHKLEAVPLMLPTLHDRETMFSLLDHVDGIILPGAASNIHPSRYGESPEEIPQTFDEEHDEADLALIRAARQKGLPFLGICRAMQAMNLAFGGTLHQTLPTGKINHMCGAPCEGHNDEPLYMHDVSIEKEGLLGRILKEKTASVNSVHEQGIHEMGKGLYAEAIAEDGLVEAISCPEASSFFLGVQWHPEAMPEHPVSMKIFSAFKTAVNDRFAARNK
jgi:putative glutamine amidotransferase